MITPSFLPFTDDDPTTAAPGTHFGHFIDDGDVFILDADRTRLKFEFDNLNTGQGNGYAADSIPIGYRRDGGDFYHRLDFTPFTPFGTTGLETIHAMRDSILGSIFVTNGTTQTITATVAQSLLGPDPGAPLQFSTGYPEYYNRPALYLEGVNHIQTRACRSTPNCQPGRRPQPHARFVNNTIIGKDGRVSFNGESALDESNDTLGTDANVARNRPQSAGVHRRRRNW